MVGYNEKEEPETATRNMSSLLKVMTGWPAHFADPKGDVAPLMALECDNGKLSALFFWLCGVLFFALDLTLFLIISNAAGWSALGFIETVNGGAGTRQSGRVLDFGDLPAPGSARAEELRPFVDAAVEMLMAATDGFPWRGLQGHAHKASDLPCRLELFDCAAELAQFLAASAVERANFTFKTPMPRWAATTGGVGLEVFCRLAAKHLESAEASMYRAEHNRWTWS
eukprot:1206264-Prymnesium_polylepis.1